MRVDPALSNLVGQVYDCSLDKDRWPVVLGEIYGVLKGKMADLSVFDGPGAAMQVHASHGWALELLDPSRHADRVRHVL